MKGGSELPQASPLEMHLDPNHPTLLLTLQYHLLILRRYQNDHLMYRLFGAHCWAWSRAFSLGLLNPSRGNEKVSMANIMI